jgi:hypothetical protein
MPRPILFALIVAFPLALGCGKRAADTIPTPAKGSNGPLTPAQQVARNVPVLQRTMGQNDLNNLRQHIMAVQVERGSYPKSLADMPGLQREQPNVYKAIQDGDIVLAGGQGGVLAYEKAATTDRGSVLTTDGIQVMTAAELKQKLGNPGR